MLELIEISVFRQIACDGEELNDTILRLQTSVFLNKKIKWFCKNSD